MVLHFKCELVHPPYFIYMGEDMHENDELIRWGWPEDVWFHVDALSSAHVYLRLKEGETIDDVPAAVIQDCAQLVKENSIQGCKLNDVVVVYTKWENLKKTNDMDVGQVSFHNNKAVYKIVVEKRNGDVIKRLNKTKEQCQHPDLRGEREKRDIRVKNKEKAALAAKKKAEIDAQKIRAAEAEKRSYDRLFVESKMRTNEDGYDSDNFM
ncbi:Coiled-coil domain-containing protein [Schistosoma japonicum]|uniref:Coiled-coil domain-containing protein 25 n=1 Tax=Schistosoma japonicum TaxID=6182 RepID=A0A4Z2CUZ1_SCHJA|nr:Coiled-coil domain-containing protein [Schistosoma japonicum]TNN08071.1 Coiled-coil domain-containing protein [Schistosoma japonicum]